MNPSPTPTQTNVSHYTDAIRLFVETGDIESAIQMEQAMASKGIYAGSTQTELTLQKLITADPAMLRLKQHVRELVPLDDSVLITGETGTGKELIARALHGARGPRKESGTNIEVGKFVAMNCNALSTDLMMSELFGHVKGSFTGAVDDKLGKLQYAYKGTLFIDEIGDMPLSMQSALLRVLQEKCLVRVGDNKELPVEFRLVCATHRDIEGMVATGTFREDLYYRISVFELSTTPLRNRVGDIPLIIKSLEGNSKKKFPTEEFLKQNNKVKFLSGNVRELQRIVKRYNVLGTI